MNPNQILAGILAAASLSSYADESDFMVSSFVSQSIVKTSSGVKLSGHSDATYGSLARNEIGSSASYQFNPHLDIRGMATIITDGDTDGKPRLNYGLVDLHSDSGMYGVRIGRYCYDYGFYNAARNNPVYRDMELPPQGLYRDGFRYMTRSGDGVQVYGKAHLNSKFSVEVDASIGKPVLFPKQDITQTFVLDKTAGQFTDASSVMSYNVTLHSRDYGIDVKYGFLLMDYQFSTPYVDSGKAFPMRAKNNYLGIRKYFDFGDLTLEYMRTDMGVTKWDSLMPAQNYAWGGVKGSNITYKHYLTDKVSLIVGYDVWYVNNADKDGKGMEAVSYGTTPAASMYHKSINLGVSHRLGPYTVKLEAHRVHGTNTVRAEGNDVLSKDQPSSYNIFMATATYRF